MSKKIEDMAPDEAFAAGMADSAQGDQASGAEPSAQPNDAEKTPDPAANDVGDAGVDTDENASQPETQDPLSALPEDLRNRFVELESANRTLQQELAKSRNDHASMAGKLRPLQQKLAALESQRDAASAAPPSAPSPQTAEEFDALLDTEEFKEWAKVFPEEAKVWRANTRRIIEVAEKIAERRVSQAVQSLTGRIDPVLQSVQQDQAAREREQRIAELSAVHPDWQEHSESDEFSDWFNNEYMPSLPDEIQAQYADPAVVARALSQPRYAARVLTEYKRDRGLTSAASPARAAPAPPAAPTKTNPRLALSAAPQTAPPPPKTRVSLADLSPEQQFLAGLNATD